MYLRLIGGNQCAMISGYPDATYMPWGISPQGYCIWASIGTTLNSSTYGLQPTRFGKDSNDNNRRKVAFESELAALVLLKHHGLVMQVVQDVTTKALTYIRERLECASKEDKEEFTELKDDLAKNLVKYLWTDASSPYFGTLGDKTSAPTEPDPAIDFALNAVQKSSSIPVHLNFQRVFAEHLIDLLEEEESTFRTQRDQLEEELRLFKKYTSTPPQREPRGGNPLATDTIGTILHPEDGRVTGPVQLHMRAVDKIKKPQVEDPVNQPFYKGLVKHDMPYGTGASGSSTALFLCARLMGVVVPEQLKEYGLAVMAFLLGGGMHSFHEIMKSAKQAGVPYKAGDYRSALPQKLLDTNECRDLIAKYGDIF